MKNTIVLLLTALTMTSAWANDKPIRVGDFALLDNRGDFHQMNWYQDHRAVVMLATSASCEGDTGAIQTYGKLKTKFSEQGVAFMLLNADGSTDRAQVTTRMQQLGIDSVALMDDSQLVSETLGVERSCEFIVYDPNSFSV